MKKESESQFPTVAEAQAHIGLDLEKKNTKPLESLPLILIGFETDLQQSAADLRDREA